MIQEPEQHQFGSTEHLAAEAVVAYVDSELPLHPYLRASTHLSKCMECAAEVDAQRQARRALQHADTPSMPAGLFGALSRIPETTGEQTVATPQRYGGIAGFVGFRLRRR